MKNMTLEHIAQACGGTYIGEECDRKKEIQGAVIDSRLVEEGTVKAHTAALEQKVAVLQQELAHQAANAADADEDDVPWETGTVIDVRMPQERAVNVHTEVVEGQKCLVIPLTGDESARINGVEVE